MGLNRRLRLWACLDGTPRKGVPFGLVVVTLWIRVVRFVRRVALAGRFYLRLNYSWRLAWIKADRGQQ